MNKNDREPIDETNIVLLVGSFDNIRISNEIYVARRKAKTRRLTSSPDNWMKIIQEIENAKKDDVPVFVNFSEAILLISCNEEYRTLFVKLLDALVGSQHILFIYQDAFIGKYNIFNKSFYPQYLFYNRSHSSRDFSSNERINAHNISVVKTYFEAVDYYCSEILSKLSIPLDNERQKDIVSHISHCYKCSADRKRLPVHRFSGENEICNFINSPCYAMALRISRKLIMLSIAEDEREIEYRIDEFLSKLLFDGETNKTSLWVSELCVNCSPMYPEFYSDTEIVYDVIQGEYESERLEEFNEKRKTKPSENMFFEYWLKKFIVEKNADIAKAVRDITNTVDQIKERNLNVVPYLHSVELFSVIRDFLSESESETIYTRYIYKDQLFAFELERFLTLFQDYITKVKGTNVVFEEKRTEIGIVYMLKSTDKNLTKYNISKYAQEFAEYLDKCDNNVEFAKSMLSNECLTDVQREALALRFQKEAMRIKKDIIQEAERKMMNLRHHYEDILLETAIDALPLHYDLSTDLLKEPISNLLKIDNKGIVNIQYIYGDATFNENDEQLFSLIEKYADSNQELIDAVKILKDGNTPKENKNVSAIKLKKFLANAASKIGEVGFKLLNKYLETLLFG